jgi:hypothetical protein
MALNFNLGVKWMGQENFDSLTVLGLKILKNMATQGHNAG